MDYSDLPPAKRFRPDSNPGAFANLPRSINLPLVQILALGDFEVGDDESSCRRANLLVHEEHPSSGWMLYDFERPPKIISVLFEEQHLPKQSIVSIYLGMLLADVQLEKMFSTMQVIAFRPHMVDPRRHILPSQEQQPPDFAKRLLNLSPDILNHRNSGQGYNFLTRIVWQFGNHTTADGSFSRLKLMILMSLVGQLEKATDDFPDAKVYSSLLAFNDEDLIVDRLFQWASNHFGRRVYFHSSVTHTLAGTTEAIRVKSSKLKADDSSTSSVIDFVHAGTLAMSADGIHLMTVSLTLDMLPKRELENLAHTLQSGQIHSKERIGTGLNEVDRRLRSIVWAQASLSDFRTPTLGRGAANRSKLTSVAHLFGLIASVAQSPFAFCRPAPGPKLITEDEWHEYLNLALEIEPKFSEEAEALLGRFFAQDTNMPEDSTGTRLVNLMFSMTKSLARLNLRLEVCEEDVLLAILLYHERLQVLYDYLPDRFFLVDMAHFKTKAENSGSLCEFQDYQDDYMQRFREFLLTEWQ